MSRWVQGPCRPSASFQYPGFLDSLGIQLTVGAQCSGDVFELHPRSEEGLEQCGLKASDRKRMKG